MAAFLGEYSRASQQHRGTGPISSLSKNLFLLIKVKILSDSEKIASKGASTRKILAAKLANYLPNFSGFLPCFVSL